MVGVAQLVRAPGCGPGGHGFNSHHSPYLILSQKAKVISQKYYQNQELKNGFALAFYFSLLTFDFLEGSSHRQEAEDIPTYRDNRGLRCVEIGL